MRDVLVFVGIVTSFFLSAISLIFRNLVQVTIFFDILLVGLILVLYSSPRIWVALSGFVVLAFLLIFEPKTLNLWFSMVYLALLMVWILVFYILIPRRLNARVLLADSEWAVIDTKGNFFAGIPKGIYAAKSKKGIKKGDHVLVRAFGKWGRRELRILEKQS